MNAKAPHAINMATMHSHTISVARVMYSQCAQAPKPRIPADKANTTSITVVISREYALSVMSQALGAGDGVGSSRGEVFFEAGQGVEAAGGVGQ